MDENPHNNIDFRGVWPPPPAGFTAEGENTADINTSGTKRAMPEPIAGYKWNWGAFFLNWLWMMNHRMIGLGIVFALVQLPLAAIWVTVQYAVFVVLRSEHLDTSGNATPDSGTLRVLMVICIVWMAAFLGDLYLGYCGHKLAWRKRRFLSVEHYISVESLWRKWGIICGITVGAISILDVLYMALS